MSARGTRNENRSKENIYKNRHVSKIIDILLPFTQDYKRRIHVRELARELGINHQTSNKYLNLLQETSILKYDVVGRNKEYFLNFKSQAAFNAVLTAEAWKSVLLLLKYPLLNALVKDLAKHSKWLIVFGSYARFEAEKNSDLDVVLEASNRSKIKRLMRSIPVKVHVQFTNLEGFEKKLRKKNPLALEIAKQHVIVKGVDVLTGVFWRWNYGSY